MKGKLRGVLGRRQEIRNKISVDPYNWIKCLPRKENKKTKNQTNSDPK